MMNIENKKLVEPMCAPSFSTDSHNVLTPTYFMQILEDRGGLHANLFNMGYDNLIKERLAWVVSRLHIHFVRPLKWREDFIFSTWHRGQEGGLFYRREAKMSTPDGEDIIQATTGWLLLNIDTRSMVRHYEVAESEDTICLDKAVEESAPRLRIPASVQMQLAYVHPVMKSDIDRNGHVNNTKYAQMAMNALPDELCTEKGIKDFYINFVHESKPNDKLDIYIGEDMAASEDGRVFYVEGKVEGKTSFLVKIVL